LDLRLESVSAYGRGSGFGSGGGAGGVREMSVESITKELFGAQVTASKLGVILDVSGSAHSHLRAALAEINSKFPDAVVVGVVGCGMLPDSPARVKRNPDRYRPEKIRVVAYSERNEDYADFPFSPVAQLKPWLSEGENRRAFARLEEREGLFLVYGGLYFCGPPRLRAPFRPRGRWHLLVRRFRG